MTRKLTLFFTLTFICQFRDEKGTGAEICPANASGIDTPWGRACQPLAIFSLSLKTVPEVFAKVYSAQFFLVSKQGNWKALDSKTRTSTSTRFELKFFRVFSKYRLPGKLQFTIFHQKSSHCYL